MEQQNVLEQILEGSIKPTHLPLETLRKITEDFSVDRLIGEGGFGKVYKGVVGNKNVAVKRIRSSMTIDQKLFRREVGSQMDVNHENVVRFLGLCSHTVETPMENPEAQGRYIYAEIRERLLCFEFVSNGSLDKYITDELRGLEWGTRYQIIKGICAGLHYLQTKKNILHLDLKPANILLDNQMVPKITDFGLSRPIEISQTMTTHYFSSLGYGAPENQFGHGTMSVKSDMYSLGAIIIELVTGQKGIPDNTNNVLRRWRHSWNKTAKETTKETPLEYHHQVTECIEIGKLCMNLDPHTRPSISQVMDKFVEMESTKINPIRWEDDMLGVEPLELRFGFNKEQILSCSVELSNDTDVYIAFKIETRSHLPYSIEPNKDIVKPRSKFSVDIKLPFASIQDYKAALQYSSSNQRYSKELIVQSLKVNEGLTTKDINKNMFDKHKEGHHVDEIHLVVVSEESYSEEVPLLSHFIFFSKKGCRAPASASIDTHSLLLH
jgi:serine/threonine protein kinase